MSFFLLFVLDVKSALEVELTCCIYACIIGAFEDPDIIHVDDIVDPVRDLEVISAELRLKVCYGYTDAVRQSNIVCNS